MAHQPAPVMMEGTAKTPAVIFDMQAGSFRMGGCSIPENADRFFMPLLDLLETYSAAPAPRTTVRVELTYFNSSSAKYLLDMFKRLEDVHSSGASRVLLEWCHAPGDMDMVEAGNDYRSLLEFPVKLIEAGF